jgi:hypothetical protein
VTILRRNSLACNFGASKSGQNTAFSGDNILPKYIVCNITDLHAAFHLQDFWNGICKLADRKLILQTVTPLVIQKPKESSDDFAERLRQLPG